MDRFDLNNVDVSTLGVIFLDGIYSELLKFPEPKEDLINDWKDQHGEEVDLNNRFYKSTPMSLKLLIKGSSRADYLSKKQAVIAIVTAGRFNLKAYLINRQFDLRYVSPSNEKDYGTCGEVTINVKNDFPQLITSIA